MSNWLQSATKSCCDKLGQIATSLQEKEEAFVDANDKYYRLALEAFDRNDLQEKNAIAFVAAVNTDINRSRYSITGLGHTGSATKVLQSTITHFCQTYDTNLAAIVNDHESKVSQQTFDNWRDQLIIHTLEGLGTSQELLEHVLRGTSNTCILNAWNSAVKLVAPQEAVGVHLESPVMGTRTYGVDGPLHEEVQPQDEDQCTSVFYHLANEIKALLQDWAEEINHAYSIFQQTLSNFHYLSARDLFFYIHKVGGTDKPITITPYTTQNNHKGLLITIGGTDPKHCWDDSIITDLKIAEELPDNPYMSDVKNAIVSYMYEHPQMEGSLDVTFVGYSLGGMIAQMWARALSSNKRTVALAGYQLHVTNVVTYGSPVMAPPVEGVHYAMYNAIYDPIPLLSLYENPQHLWKLRSLTEELVQLFPPNKSSTEIGRIGSLVKELGQNRRNVVHCLGDFFKDAPDVWCAYTSIVQADQEPWDQKLESYIDVHHRFKDKIFSISDVGHVSLNVCPPIGHILNLDNHLHYNASDELNAAKTAEVLPNINLQSWGPTEYFGMGAFVAQLTKVCK